MNEYTYEDCILGKQEQFTIVFTDDMMKKFKNLTGDLNPLHNEECYALEQGFRSKISYGMLTASFLSTLAGMYLPGKYCLIQEVHTKFVKPVYIGDEITFFGEVADRNDLFKQLELKISAINSVGEAVLRGKMKVGIIEKRREEK